MCVVWCWLFSPSNAIWELHNVDVHAYLQCHHCCRRCVSEVWVPVKVLLLLPVGMVLELTAGMPALLMVPSYFTVSFSASHCFCGLLSVHPGRWLSISTMAGDERFGLHSFVHDSQQNLLKKITVNKLKCTKTIPPIIQLYCPGREIRLQHSLNNK